MLESTDMSINKISEAVGYSGTRSFFSAFKNKYGITPMNYRRAKAASTSVDNGAGESSLRRS
jgi:AraC-like DNA-binding protein